MKFVILQLRTSNDLTFPFRSFTGSRRPINIRRVWRDFLEADRNLSVAKHAGVETGSGDLPERISWKRKTMVQNKARPTHYDKHRHSGHVTAWFFEACFGLTGGLQYFLCAAASNSNASKLQISGVN